MVTCWSEPARGPAIISCMPTCVKSSPITPGAGLNLAVAGEIRTGKTSVLVPFHNKQ